MVTNSAEQAAEQAIREFEEKQKRLRRADGSRRYSDAEHDERLEALRAELRQKIGGLIEQAENTAARHEQELLTTSYTGPFPKDLTSVELNRLSVARLLISEDCERLPLDERVERLAAGSASNDTVAKILHARYGAVRARTIREQFDAAARAARGARRSREGRRLPAAPGGFQRPRGAACRPGGCQAPRAGAEFCPREQGAGDALERTPYGGRRDRRDRLGGIPPEDHHDVLGLPNPMRKRTEREPENRTGSCENGGCGQQPSLHPVESRLRRGDLRPQPLLQ
jgi:hypothetical protein